MKPKLSLMDADGRPTRSIEVDEVQWDVASAPTAGMGTPPIDHDRVTAAAEALRAGPFSAAQTNEALEQIRADRQALADRKAAAKVALQDHVPDADIAALAIAWNIYVAAESDADAASRMRAVAGTVRDVADIYQPSLF